MTFRKLETKISNLELGVDARKLFEAVKSKDYTKLKSVLKTIDEKSLSPALSQQNANGCNALGIAAEDGVAGEVLFL